MVTRAVHIELYERTTSTSTLLAIKRFVSCRGLPELFVSDNASNFQRCAALLDKNVKPTNEEEQALERMPSLKWKFNPPGAPYYGGNWERLIGLAKRIFFNIANSQYLSRELFTSLMCEIEQLLKSRTLPPVSLSIHDVESLTPNHFLRPVYEGCETQDLITFHGKKQSLLLEASHEGVYSNSSTETKIAKFRSSICVSFVFIISLIFETSRDGVVSPMKI